MIVRMVVLGGLVSLGLSTGLSAPAMAADSCVAQDMIKIKAMLEQNSRTGVFGNSLAPAIAYENLNGNQLRINGSSGGVQAHINEVAARLQMGVDAFFQSSGDPAVTAKNTLGHPERRQIFQILRRPKGAPNAGANANNKCDASSCEDMAIKSHLMYVLNNSSVQKAVDALSIYKLESTGTVDVLHCEASASCNQRVHVLKPGGAVRKDRNPGALRANVPYVVREAAMGVETTTLYRVQSVSICGKPAALMTGVLIRGANSLDNSSTVALAVESNNRVLVLGHYQGYVAGNRGKIPGLMLGGGLFGSFAIKGMKGIYNNQAEKLGTRERVDGNGMLK